MITTRIAVIVCAALLGCTPNLAGVCSSNADCKAGETCSPEGLCLGPNGTSGGSAGVELLSPAAGAIEPGSFHVSAQVTAGGVIRDVTFVLTNAQTGAAAGQLVVATASGGTYSGSLALDSQAFGGAADLRAVLHRDGLADVVSSKVTVTVDQNAPSIATTWDASRWWALDAGVTVTATVTDDRSGASSADLVLPDGGSVAGTIQAGVATFAVPAADVGIAGTASLVPFSLAATDVAGNTALNKSVSGISVDDEPPGVSVQALDPTVWRTGPLDFTATVGDGAGSGVGAASLLAAGAFTAGQPDAGGVFTFHTDLAQAFPGTEGAVTLQVVARDAVGNNGDAGFTLLVDDVPPAVSDVRVDSAPDLTDLAGTGWFKGPTVAPGLPDIQVSAIVTDANLASPPPSAMVGGTAYPGTFSGGRWTFAIPRSAAANAAGDFPVTFDAQDAAGNHPVSPPPLVLHVDDQKTLSPAAGTDSAYHGPAETVSISISVAPPSGFPIASGAVDLPSAGKLSIGTCTGAAAIPPDAGSTIATAPASSTLVFKVPVGTCVGAGTDAAVAFSATVNSLVGGAGTATGSLNVDTHGPVVGNVSVFYPANAAGTPAGWSHDGSHFQRRDSGALFAFSAYDCHGLAASPASVSLSGLTSLSVTSAADSTGFTPTCTPPDGVTRFTVSGNLAAMATSSLPALDNAPGWSALLTDAFGNQSPASGSINVTRKLWQAAPGGTASFLTLGPKLFAGGSGGLYAFDPATGAQGTWSGASTQMPLLATNGGTPAVIYSAGNLVYAGNAASTTPAQLSGASGCAHGNTLDAISLGGASTVNYTSHSLQWDGTTCDPTCIPSDSCPGTSLCSQCRVCQVWSNVYFTDQVLLSGGSYSCGGNGPGAGTNCAGASAPPGGLSNAVMVTSPATLYVGSNGTSWAAYGGATPLNTYGATLSAGAWPLIDGSPSPISYLPGVFGTPGRIDAVQLGAGGFGSLLYSLGTFPAAITDMQLGAGGILYVLSNNLVHAVITDSQGSLANQASGWPSQCHDPCRSSIGGYACAY